MAAVYFLGGKKVTTKSGDKFVIPLLCHDSYHNPEIRSFWEDFESEVAQNAAELMPGVAVNVQTVFGNERHLSFIEENAEFPVLDLTAFLDTKF